MGYLAVAQPAGLRAVQLGPVTLKKFGASDPPEGRGAKFKSAPGRFSRTLTQLLIQTDQLTKKATCR